MLNYINISKYISTKVHLFSYIDFNIIFPIKISQPKITAILCIFPTTNIILKIKSLYMYILYIFYCF